ncbi:MAG: hypothetical protein ACOXZH_02970 [Bacteroidales bacterium]|nr:hypothetical protein [Bacteroidales bacterium]
MKRQIIIAFIIGMTLISCKQNNVDGIIIEKTLYAHQDFKSNRQLRNLIKKTLEKDEKALVELKKFYCGDGAACYDLGFIITQIIYRLGEEDFIQMVNKLENEEIYGLQNLIVAGLEYGDNDKDGKMDKKRIENEFPELLNLFNKKTK